MAFRQDEFPQWVRDTRPPVPLPPAKSCDCQFHIYGDPKKYPPKAGAYYDPPDATFEHMRGVLKTMGFERGVIVHPMPYDTDHSLLVDTLSGLSRDERKNFRATGIIKDNVSDNELAKLNSLGEEKLALMLKDDDSPSPMTVYLNLNEKDAVSPRSG